MPLFGLRLGNYSEKMPRRCPLLSLNLDYLCGSFARQWGILRKSDRIRFARSLLLLGQIRGAVRVADKQVLFFWRSIDENFRSKNQSTGAKAKSKTRAWPDAAVGLCRLTLATVQPEGGK